MIFENFKNSIFLNTSILDSLFSSIYFVIFSSVSFIEHTQWILFCDSQWSFIVYVQWNSLLWREDGKKKLEEKSESRIITWQGIRFIATQVAIPTHHQKIIQLNFKIPLLKIISTQADEWSFQTPKKRDNQKKLLFLSLLYSSSKDWSDRFLKTLKFSKK